MQKEMLNDVKQGNPWDVASIFEFNYFICPECDCKLQMKQDFINHATYNHPWVRTKLIHIHNKFEMNGKDV